MGTECARRELLATGEIVRRRTVETVDEFTAQPAQIARLASDRLTIAEISIQLFLSRARSSGTCARVFAKLGISPRRQLRGRCPIFARVALPA